MAQANVVAKVVLVVGQAYAKSSNGSMRKLAVGDVIREGEQIVTSQGGRVELAFDDGTVRLARVNEPVHPDSFATSPSESEQKPAELAGGDAKRVVDALAQGRNLDDLLEDPAAGLRTGGGRTDGGHDFVRLDRIVEPVTPLSFEFGAVDRSVEFPIGGLATDPLLNRNSAPDVLPDTNTVTERVDSTVPSTTSGNVLTTGTHGTGFTDQADADPEGDLLTVTQAQFGASPAVVAGTPMTLAYGTLILNPDGTYTYSVDNTNPAVNALNVGGILTEVVTYTVTDENGGTATTTLTITINGANDSPTATVGAPIVGPEDSPGIVVPLRGTDPDSPLQSVTVTSLPPASQGKLLKPDGTPVVPGEPIPVGPDGTAQLTFVPVHNFNGTVNIPFIVTDNQGAPSPGATQQIIVTPVNDLPVANDDSASTPNGQPVTIGVLGNDSDPDGDRLTIVGTPTAPNGTVTVNPDGTLTYRPNPGFSGTDTFTYTVTDPSGATDTATVRVSVAPPPPPSLTVSIGDATPVAEGGSLQYTVTLSGGTSTTNITIPLTYAGTADPVLDINGQPVSVTIIAGSTSATVTVPTLTDGIAEVPETVLVNLGTPSNPAVTVADGQGTGTITDVGAPSLTVSIGDATPVAEGGSLQYTVTLSGGTSTTNITIPLTYAGTADPVLDINGQPVSVTIIARSTSATVTVPTLTDGIAESPETVLVNLGTPSNPAVSVADGQGTGTITDLVPLGPTVSIRDDNGGAAGEKTLPETAGPTAGEFTVTAPAGLASITVGGTAVTEAQLNNLGTTPVTINTGEGTLVLTGYNPATGVVSYTYDPNVQSVNGDVTDVIPLVVTDDLGNVSPANSLDIVITDSVPVAADDADSVTEDTDLVATGTVLPNDTVGADTNATPVSPANVTLTYGSLVLNGDGSYTYTLNNTLPAVNALNAGQTLTDTYTYTLTDGDGTTDTAVLTITINGTSDGPVLDLDANNSSGAAGANYTTTFTENGAAVAIADTDVSVTDVDSTNLTGATITLTNAQAGDVLAAGALPAGITASIVGNVVTLSGAATLANYQTAIRAITFANTSENPATVARNLTVVVTDGTNSSNTASTTINVVALNDPPVNTVPGAQSTTEDVARVFSAVNGNALTVADVDGGTLTTTVSVTNGVLNAVAFAGATITSNGSGTVTISGTAAAINGALNGLSFAPNGDYSGAAQLSVSTSDGTATDSDTVAINVVPVADAPTVYAHVTSNGMITSANSLFAANFNGGGALTPATGWTANPLFGNSFAEIPGGNGKTQTETTLFNSVAWNGQTGSNTTEQTNFANRWATRANAGESADGSTFAVYNQGGVSGSDDAQGFLQYTGAALTSAEKASTSYVITAQLFADAGSAQANGVGFVFGYVDDNNYFLARWENPSPDYAPGGSQFNGYPGQYQELSLVQVVGGVPVDLARTAFAGDDWFNLSISVSNTGIAVTATDITSSATASLNYAYGSVAGGAVAAPALSEVGFYSFDDDSAVRFDNLTINTGVYRYTLNTEAYLNDTDGSETLSAITLTGVPAGVTLMDGATPITVTGGTATVPIGDAITMTSATALTNAQINAIQASVTATETANGSTASDSDNAKLDVIGTVAVDALNGTASDEWLEGRTGNDTLNGGGGNDVLIGGIGNDALDGGAGVDVLVWKFADRGGADTVQGSNFGTATGTDALDLRDLLQGEAHGAGIGNLANYIDIVTAGADTVIRVSSAGGFSGGTYVAGQEDQRITLTGVDLFAAFVVPLGNDNAVIQELLNRQKLIVD